MGLLALAPVVLTTQGAWSADEMAPMTLAGTVWGFADETGKKARFVQFGADNKVSGHLGCNRFAGSYAYNNGELKFGPLASTKMACPPPFMEREREFATTLGSTRMAEASTTRLILKDGEGKTLAELVRRDPD